MAFVGPFEAQYVMIFVNNVRQFRLLMQIMLRVDFHLELKRLLRNIVHWRNHRRQRVATPSEGMTAAAIAVLAAAPA